MRRPIERGRAVVVKIGSSSLTTQGGLIDADAISRVVAQIAELRRSGHPAVLVSSGAVAAGLPALGVTDRPTDVPGLQAAAAVGQSKLIEQYAGRMSAFVKERLIENSEFDDRDLQTADQSLHRNG